MTETIQQSEPSRPPILFLIADEMLAHAKAVYPDGEYRWQCGSRVRQMAFEAATVVVLPDEEAKKIPINDPDSFTFCGIHARVSPFMPWGRLELYHWVQGQYGWHRVVFFEFPSD